MNTCLGKSCSFGLPRVPFVNYCQFMYLVISLLVLRTGCGILLYEFRIIAYLFTLQSCHLPVSQKVSGTNTWPPCLLHQEKKRKYVNRRTKICHYVEINSDCILS